MSYLEIISEQPGYKYLVRCVCGTEKLIRKYHFSVIKSCGCKRKELIGNATRIHGMSRTTEHVIWMTMLQRCYYEKSKSYKDYGGRGIYVCERWRGSFENFYADMGPRPPKLTIERLDNDGPYAPGNCIWADRVTQMKNRRRCPVLQNTGHSL
jgi:hypothetical protein